MHVPDELIPRWGIDSYRGTDSYSGTNSYIGTDSFEESIPVRPIPLNFDLKEPQFTIPIFEDSIQH